MWKQVLEAKVVRVEGIDESNLYTQLTVSNNKSEDLFPYNQDKAFELSANSICRFHIHTLDNTISFSVTFNTLIVEEDGVHWLPLFPSNQPDTIQFFPEEVKTPRILILLHKKLLLDIIKEGGERSELGSACEEDYMPEIKLCSSFFDGSVQEFEEADEVTEKVVVSEGLNVELEENLRKIEKLLAIEKKAKENLMREMENMKKVFDDELDQARLRESELIEEYRKAEMQGSEYKVLTAQMKNELNSVKSENLKLSSLLQYNEISNNNKLEELRQKLEVYEQNHSHTDQIFTKLNEMTSRSMPDTSALQEKDEIIEKLINEVNTLKRYLMNSTKAAKAVDELEEAIQKFTKGTKLEGILVRDREQTYIYNNKKVSIILKDGQLLCRVGGIFKPFSDYLQTSFQPDSSLMKLLKSPQDSRPPEDRSKASPIRKVNKSLTSTSKSTKRGSLV